MNWQKVTFKLTGLLEGSEKDCSDFIDEFSELLTTLGALSVTLEAENQDAVLEPLPDETPLWKKTQITALFDETVYIPGLKIFLRSVIPKEIHFVTCVTEVAEQDWQKLCEDSFPPLCFKDKLWICPTWSDVPQDAKPLVLLDPGLAFGTGTHPTTALCLEWLAEHPVQPYEVLLDYGCGSGILAIAAIKLGFKKVWAVDYDPQALMATQNNATLNHVTFNSEDAEMQICLPEQMPQKPVDIIIANIVANPLIELAPGLMSLLRPGGKIILSGILDHQVKSIEEAYRSEVVFSSPVFSMDSNESDTWVRLEGRRVTSLNL